MCYTMVKLRKSLTILINNIFNLSTYVKQTSLILDIILVNGHGLRSDDHGELRH